MANIDTDCASAGVANEERRNNLSRKKDDLCHRSWSRCSQRTDGSRATPKPTKCWSQSTRVADERNTSPAVTPNVLLHVVLSTTAPRSQVLSSPHKNAANFLTGSWTPPRTLWVADSCPSKSTFNLAWVAATPQMAPMCVVHPVQGVACPCLHVQAGRRCPISEDTVEVVQWYLTPSLLCFACGLNAAHFSQQVAFHICTLSESRRCGWRMELSCQHFREVSECRRCVEGGKCREGTKGGGKRLEEGWWCGECVRVCKCLSV